ncbi:hypothetical protein PMAYCL1PPCAC_19947, partial [Pristionchus mayeri]
SGDFCNDFEGLSTDWEKGGNLTCANETHDDTYKNCPACVQIREIDGSRRRGCSGLPDGSIDDLMRPQSCVRFQTSASDNYIRCVCDTEDQCGESLMKEQRLKSSAVTCAMGALGKKGKCKGDFCFIYRPVIRPGLIVVGDEMTRGCVTNNETLYPGLFKVCAFSLYGENEVTEI